MASGCPLSEFAAAAGVTFMAVVQVWREVLWLDPDNPDDPREEIDLDPLAASGDLQRLVLTDDEIVRFVALAREIDDGEAATLAVAESRGLAVATDDRKARRILSTLSPQLAVTSTAALVRAWAVDRIDEDIRTCIKLIERRASFVPTGADPDGDWWRSWT